MQAIIFSGLQASGKSSFYRERFFNTHIRINLDMLKTRYRENLLLVSCLEMKQPFVVDNTNPTIEERAKYINLASAVHFEIIGYYFQSNLQDCLNRNEQRFGKEHISPKGIIATYRKFQIPALAEGFNQLYNVRIEENKFIVNEWLDKQ